MVLGPMVVDKKNLHKKMVKRRFARHDKLFLDEPVHAISVVTYPFSLLLTISALQL